MATDMLRLTDDGEGFRGELVMDGETGPDGGGGVPSAVRSPAGRGAAARGGAASCPFDMQALLARAVIPRLHAALQARGVSGRPPVPAITLPHRGPAARPRHPRRDLRCDEAGCDDGERDALIGDLVDGLLADDLAGVCGRIDALRAGGRSLERIYVDLLTPAAVRLSRLVEDDLCSPAAGTIASCNLQLVLRRYASDFYGEGRPCGTGGRALLVSLPAGTDALRGLQVFGLLLAADFLRRQGWDAWMERSFRSSSFKETVLTQWFDLVEVLAGDEDDLDEITAGIRTLRRGGINPGVGIVACGRIFTDHPEYVRLVGADRGVADPLSALPHLPLLAGRQPRRPC